TNAQGKLFPLRKSWLLKEIARYPKKKSRNYFKTASHDRRAVSLGGSNRDASRLHRDAAGYRQSSGRAWLRRGDLAADGWAAKTLRDLRSDCARCHRASRGHRAFAHGRD